MAKKIRAKSGIVSGESEQKENDVIITLFVLKNVMGRRYGDVIRVPINDSIRSHINAGNLKVVEEPTLKVRVEEDVVDGSEDPETIGEEEV